MTACMILVAALLMAAWPPSQASDTFQAEMLTTWSHTPLSMEARFASGREELGFPLMADINSEFFALDGQDAYWSFVSRFAQEPHANSDQGI